tara:strand:+ start:836 stop:1840 length:1005 start_codon:yes stop_codon:yes gene_type:complete
MKDLRKLLIFCKKYAKRNKKKFYFIIANTAKLENNDYYLTPLRDLDGILFSGIVIYNDNNLNKILNLISKYADKILLDLEKKISNAGKILFTIKKKIQYKKKIEFVKPNDLTVDSAYYLIIENLRKKILNNKNIHILFLGLGNIGSKLAIKLVESNIDVFILARDKKKTSQIIKSLELIKVRYNKNKIKLINNKKIKKDLFDIVVSLLPNPNNLLNAKLLKKIRSSQLILDIGKGGFGEDEIKFIKKNKLKFLRLDPEVGFEGFIKSNIHLKKNFLKKIGRKIYDKKGVISGGFPGENGDLVTEDFRKPIFFYGSIDNKNNFFKRFLIEKKIKL